MSALRSVFAVPDYRRLWTARTVSQWGDTFRFVALMVVVYRLTGSGLGVTGVVVAEVLPVLLLAPLAGVLVHRVPRVAVLATSDVVRAVLAGVLALRHGDVVTSPSAPWHSASCSRRCPREPPARSSWCSARCSSSGSCRTRPAPPSCSAPTPCAASSTSCWPRRARSPWPPRR